MWVYTDWGMCVDVEDVVRGKGGIVEERWDEVYDGAFASFEEVWASEGGVIGGW